MPEPITPLRSAQNVITQIADDGLFGRRLDSFDVPACRAEVAKRLRPGVDPGPFLRALEALETLQMARRDLRDALDEIGRAQGFPSFT